MEFHVYCFWPNEKQLNRALCNKTITTLELEQYEVLWSRVKQY